MDPWRTIRTELLTLLFIYLTHVTNVNCRDLTMEPGHLKPFGEGRPSQSVPEWEGFPSPEEFFNNNVKPLRPLKLKGAAKIFPAFHTWTDDYFLSAKEPAEHSVSVETVKKETRTQKMLSMPFREFVRIYNESSYYMVNAVPEFISHDVVVPCSLQCKSIVEKSLADNVMWFSSGGTNSVVHTDSFDNMNCLLRGNKTLVFVDPSIYKDKVDLDHPEGSYSDVDVDRVDYLKYPGLADVEFYHVNVTAGDCLYIPYKWIHQVRSYGSNIAVNVWWHHYLRDEIDFDECNKQCDHTFTLDKAIFKEMGEEGMSPEEVRDHFLSLISVSKSLDFNRFVIKLLGGTTAEELDQEFETGLMQIFSLIDQDKDGVITKDEIIDTTNETYEEVWNIMSYLNNEMDEEEDNGEYYEEDDSNGEAVDDLIGDLDQRINDVYQETEGDKYADLEDADADALDNEIDIGTLEDKVKGHKEQDDMHRDEL